MKPLQILWNSRNMLRITTSYRLTGRGLTAAHVACTSDKFLRVATRAINGFVLRSLSSCLLYNATEISRRFSSSLPPLFAARRCATHLYATSAFATRGVR
jgi:hypothetical protein